jgi:predicted site-specific integrase-resolvase
MITPESAANLADVETPTLYQWAYSGRIHYVEEGPDRMFICLKSLPLWDRQH